MPTLFRTPRLNPRLVPQVPVEIDWSHPLAANLIGLYLPSRSTADLAGNGPPIFPQSATTFIPSGSGSGASSLVANSGMLSTQVPTRFQRAPTYLAIMHVGWHTSTSQGATASQVLFGMSFSGATFLPFTIITNAGNFQFATNAGSNFGTYGTGFTANLGLNVIAATNWTGGGNSALYCYKNGVLGTAGFSTTVGNINWTAGPNCRVDMCNTQWTAGTSWENCISLAGMFFDSGAVRLPDSTFAWLGNEPFAMLRPIVRRTYLTPPPAVTHIPITISQPQRDPTIMIAA